MLDISTVTAEERRKEDLGELFERSHLRECVPHKAYLRIAPQQKQVLPFCTILVHGLGACFSRSVQHFSSIKHAASFYVLTQHGRFWAAQTSGQVVWTLCCHA